MLSGILGFLLIIAALGWFLTARNLHKTQLLKKQICAELPFLYFFCNADGKILRGNVGNAQSIWDLPELKADETIQFIRSVFDTAEPLEQEFPAAAIRLWAKRASSAAPKSAAVVCLVWDISEELAFRQNEEHQTDKYQALLDSVSDGLIAVNADGLVTVMNPAAAELIDYPQSLAIGKPIHELFHLQTRTRTPIQLPLDEIRTTNRSIMLPDDVELFTNAGNRYRIKCKLSPIPNKKEKSTEIILTFCNITKESEQKEILANMCKQQELSAESAKISYFLYTPSTSYFSKNKQFDENWPILNGAPIDENLWVHKDDLPTFQEHRRQLLAGELDVLRLHYRSNYKGKTRYFRISATLTNDPVTATEKSILGIIQDITTSTVDEQKFNDTHQFLKTLLSVIPCPFFLKDVSDGYRYVFGSEMFCRMVNCSAAELPGKTDFDLFKNPQEAQQYRTADITADRADCATTNQDHTTDANGEIHCFHTIKIPYNTRDGRRLLIGIGIDISELKDMQNREREHRELFQHILDNLPVALLVKDATNDFRYIHWNRVLEEHTGYSAKQVIGKTDLEIAPFPGYQTKFHEQDLALLNSQTPLSYEENRVSAIGRKLTYHTNKLAFQQGGHTLIMELCQDLTREKNLETERLEVIRELNDHIVDEMIVNNCLRRISIENDFDTVINEILCDIGENLEANRCYIYQYTPDLAQASCIYEWCTHGTSPQLNNLQDMDMKLFPAWQNTLLAHQCIIIEDVENPPVGFEICKDILREQDICSLLCCGIFRNGYLTGFVGIDYTKKLRKFTENNIRCLQNTAMIFLLAYERKLQFDAVRESAALQKTILDMMPIPLLLVTTDYKIAHANPAALDITGVHTQSIAQTPCYKLFCEAAPPISNCPVVDTISKGVPGCYERKIAGREYQIRTLPHFSNNKIVQVLECFIDLTEINKSKKLLQEAAQAAEEAARTKSLFLATMSHELRTPLNAVIGFSELLQLGNMTPQAQQEAIHSINLAGNTLLSLINDVLDLSKLEAGQLQILLEKVNLRKLLQEIHAIFDIRLRENNLYEQLNVSPDLPLLWLDSLRLRQILLNLIGNAVKFTHSGGITINVNFSRETDSSGTLRLDIRDTGIGISQEYLPKIFNPFTQDIKTNRTRRGTGLGLPICKRLIEQMHGRIWIESKVGQGSCFHIELPNTRYELETQSCSPEPPAPPTPPKQLDASILVVDDVAMNLRVLESMAAKLQLKVHTAQSGQAALAILETYRPDVILTDLWMPEMNGVELANRIHQDPQYKTIRLIAVTADTELQNRDVEKNIFDGILLKPVTVAKLTQVLNEVLGEDKK